MARLGPRSFETISGEVVNVALLGLTRRAPSPEHTFAGWDVGEAKTPEEKAGGVRKFCISRSRQHQQLTNVGTRVVFEGHSPAGLLREYATSHNGIQTGDYPRFGRLFWELGIVIEDWEWQQTSVEQIVPFGGRTSVLFWQRGAGELLRFLRKRLGPDGISAWIRGEEAWGRRGVLAMAMRDLPTTIYTGHLFDNNVMVVVPKQEEHLPAIWAYVSSESFHKEVRKVNQKIHISDQSLVLVPFNLAHWQRIAAEKYPKGLPKPHSDDPTQWLFSGHPKGSDHPLQVAVARLAGYRWARQTGSSFPDCPALEPDGLEKHADSDGIVPLNAIAGEASAADRLRALLADVYGSEWSAAKLKELLGDWDSPEDWLRDGFFEEHCRIFHQRPFVWHIWDGRKDGFHALVNYHKLAAPNGEGRKTLEKLIYTYLGRWIERQQDEVKAGKEGADARLTAATHLKAQLEKILKGEKPYDIFVRWKPLHEQPIGWEADINDGVRLNIRPWLQTTLAPVTKPKKGACILRVTPKINYGKDRGKEPHRAKEDFPWFWTWDEQSDDFTGGNEFDGPAGMTCITHWIIREKPVKERRQDRSFPPQRRRKHDFRTQESGCCSGWHTRACEGVAHIQPLSIAVGTD